LSVLIVPQRYGFFPNYKINIVILRAIYKKI